VVDFEVVEATCLSLSLPSVELLSSVVRVNVGVVRPLGPLGAVGAVVLKVVLVVVPFTEAEAVLFVPPRAGGVSARDGSSSLPIPYRTISPAAVVSCSVGGTVFPVASAMVKRVVQRTLVEAGEVNW
jgi:hypothetical protein